MLPSQIHIPNIMTLQPLFTRSPATRPSIGAGVVSPCMKRNFSPSFGPHSYTLITPYGVATSRAPGRRSGGYGKAAACWGDNLGSRVSRGEGIVRGRGCLARRRVSDDVARTTAASAVHVDGLMVTDMFSFL